MQTEDDGDGGNGSDHHRERNAGSLGAFEVLTHDFNRLVLSSVPHPAVQFSDGECIGHEGFDGVDLIALVGFGVGQVKRWCSFNVQEQGVAASGRGVGQAGHAAVREVANHVLPRFRREQGAFGCHEDVEGVIPNAHDGELR